MFIRSLSSPNSVLHFKTLLAIGFTRVHSFFEQPNFFSLRLIDCFVAAYEREVRLGSDVSLTTEPLKILATHLRYHVLRQTKMHTDIKFENNIDGNKTMILYDTCENGLRIRRRLLVSSCRLCANHPNRYVRANAVMDTIVPLCKQCN